MTHETPRHRYEHDYINGRRYCSRFFRDRRWRRIRRWQTDSTQRLFSGTDRSLLLSARSHSGVHRPSVQTPRRRADFGSRADLFGISTDSLESHRTFIELNSLPFPLISDARKQIARVYGVWAERPEGGMGDRFQTERTTFVIAPGGRIKTILRNVDPYTHDRLLLEALYS